MEKSVRIICCTCRIKLCCPFFTFIFTLFFKKDSRLMFSLTMCQCSVINCCCNAAVGEFYSVLCFVSFSLRASQSRSLQVVLVVLVLETLCEKRFYSTVVSI